MSEHAADPAEDPSVFWENMYLERDQVWSGNVNQRMAELVTPMTPGRVLEIGAGEGGDALWLAEHGWQVTAVDISPTAIGRLQRVAAERGLGDRITAVAMDLTRQAPEGEFDLVTASFFHSHAGVDRDAIVRRVLQQVVVGGRLALVDHAEPPPWSKHEHDVKFPTVDELVANLALGDDWQVEDAVVTSRTATGPDGHTGELRDASVVARRIR